MFERFTERAREVMALAEDEARRLGHGYVGTEHLLLGLIREEHGVAARALDAHGVELADSRAWIARTVGECDEAPPPGRLPLTPRMEKIVELSLEEAGAPRGGAVDTEHLLLALVDEGQGAAPRILRDVGAPPELVAAYVRTRR